MNVAFLALRIPQSTVLTVLAMMGGAKMPTWPDGGCEWRRRWDMGLAYYWPTDDSSGRSSASDCERRNCRERYNDRHTSFYRASRTLRFLQVEGLWPPGVHEVYEPHCSNSVCSPRVSASHFGNFPNISNVFILIIFGARTTGGA